MKELFRRDLRIRQQDFGRGTKERETSAAVIIGGIGFLDLALSCLSTKPGFGFMLYFEKVFFQGK